jgi:tRNA threonylcarbamoyladenosine biosynthesis protein TsaE
MPSPLRILSNGPDETQEVGRLLGQGAEAGDVFLLTGPLGAGKTCLTQGIAQGLEVPGYVRSPTFVMVTRYQGRLTLHHIDLYRVEDSLEALDLGLEELLYGDGVCVVEWAERAADIFPENSVHISIDYGESETERSIRLDAPAGAMATLKNALKGYVVE